MTTFEEYLDIVDSFVFTGGSLHSEENREIFQEYLERWGRAIIEFEEMEDCDESDS